MENEKAAQIRQVIEEVFRSIGREPPFDINRFYVAETKENLEKGILSWNLSHSDKDMIIKIKDEIGEYNGSHIETKDSTKHKRRSIGVVRLLGFIIVFEKVRRRLTISEIGKYDLNQTYFKLLLDSIVERASERAYSKVFLGWVDEIFEQDVRVCFYDDNGDYCLAELSRSKFENFGYIEQGTKTFVQVWKENSHYTIDVKPIDGGIEDRKRRGLVKKISMGKEMIHYDGIYEPDNWADTEQVEKLREVLEERYKNVIWGRLAK